MAPAYSLAQCIERLPAHARSRYEDLSAQVSDSKALVATLMERFTKTQEEYSRLQTRYDRAIKTGSPEAAELKAELEALATRGDKLDCERHRRNGIATNAEQIIGRLRSFIEAVWMGSLSNITEPPRISVTPQLQAGESPIGAVARLRNEIGKVRSEIAMVRNAPLPKDEIQLAILIEVERLAELGRPKISMEGSRAKILFSDEIEFTMPGQAPSAPAGGASKFDCWFHRDDMIRRLIAGVEDHPNAIPAKERPARLQALDEKL